MKLTKQRLKEIIKEELAKLEEAPADPTYQRAIAQLVKDHGREKVAKAIKNATKYPGFRPNLDDVKDALGIRRDRSGGGF